MRMRWKEQTLLNVDLTRPLIGTRLASLIYLFYKSSGNIIERLFLARNLHNVDRQPENPDVPKPDSTS
jgi:hypothetical protein